MNKRFMRFPEGKKKAVTLSYDDCMEEDADLIELLEKYQMKATFNLIPGWFAKEGTTYPEGETYRCLLYTSTDDNNESLKASDAVTFNFVAGVTISGKVVDAAGQPVKYGYVTGFTKADEYGRYGAFNVRTEKDGTYVARTVPGDYYTCVGNAYDYSVGNMFYANAVKNVKLPGYKVNIATNIAGAAGYSVSNLDVISSYGVTYRVSDYDDSSDCLLYTSRCV